MGDIIIIKINELIKKLILYSRKILVSSEPDNKPMLQKAWKPDIIGLLNFFSKEVACKFKIISNNP